MIKDVKEMPTQVFITYERDYYDYPQSNVEWVEDCSVPQFLDRFQTIIGRRGIEINAIIALQIYEVE